MNKSISKIAKSFSAKIIAFVGFYVCDIILARGLCVNDYAEWAYFFSIVSIVLWISNFGISLTIRTMVAKEENIKKRKYYINCGIVLRFVVSIIFSMGFFMLSNRISVISGWPEQYPHLIVLIRTGAFLPMFMAFTELWKDIFIGSAQLGSLMIIAVCEHIGYACGCLLGVSITGDVMGALLGYYIGYMFATIGGIYLAKVSFQGFRLSERTRKDIAMIFRSAIPYVVTCIIAFVILEMDTVMIGVFRVGNAELANYTVAKKIIQKAVNVNEAFLYAMLPRFATVKGDTYIETYKSFKKIRNCNISITLLVGFGVGAILTVLVPVMYGEDYGQVSTFLIALLPAYLCNGIAQCYMQFLYYREKACLPRKSQYLHDRVSERFAKVA